MTSTQLKRPHVASAQSNTERPIKAAPSARLTHDLNRIKEQRRQRTTTPIFSPERASRQGCRGLNPDSEHLLDWFHITMRITVMTQLAKGLRIAPELSVNIINELQRLKWFL